MLPERWWAKPREIFEVIKIGFTLLINITVSAIPLKVSEPIMQLWNPEYKKRKRIESYDPSAYKIIDWDKMAVKEKHILLKNAKKEFKESGGFSISMKKSKKPDFLHPSS
jgi:hypothetical protein